VEAKLKSDESYALHEGAYGRTVVLELRNDLVAHAHADTQIAFWLGGSRSDARVVGQVVEYSEHTALGVNPYESHDAKLLDDAVPAIFLCFYIRKEWLDGNPPDKPKVREVEFSKKEVLREEVKIYRQPDHGCPEAC
jgi:hypothetical protein